MEYTLIKKQLFESNEIQRIPENWIRMPPVLCYLDGEIYDSFFFFQGSEQVILKSAILVSNSSGKVKKITVEEIIKIFDLLKFKFEKRKIEDYDVYFKYREKYEELYTENHDKLLMQYEVVKEIGMQLNSILENILGSDLYWNFFYIVSLKYS